jgi:hypothetical protein
MCDGRKPSKANNLASLYPDLAKEWHPEFNGKLKPSDVVPKSGRNIWWICSSNPMHIWKSMVWHRVDGGRNGKGTGCPYCSNQLVDINNSLAKKRPDLAAEWHPTKNGSLTPDKVVYGSHAKCWWRCPKGEDHEWKASIYNRVNADTGCPCCCGRKVVPSNCLVTTHPHIAAEWSPKNTLKPTEVTYASNRSAYFVCSKDPKHEWQARIDSRADGNGCPFCSASKGEKAIKTILEQNHIEYQQQYKFNDCTNKRRLPFDFVLFHKGKIIGAIEFQGKQHYVPVSAFGGIDAWRKLNKRDQIKEDYCKVNKIPLLRVPFWELIQLENALKKYIKIIL